jgi:hypothetical protein
MIGNRHLGSQSLLEPRFYLLIKIKTANDFNQIMAWCSSGEVKYMFVKAQYA